MFICTSDAMILNTDAVAFFYVDTEGDVMAQLREPAIDAADGPVREVVVAKGGGKEVLDELFDELLDDRAPSHIDYRQETP